jgi:hypothetical protein
MFRSNKIEQTKEFVNSTRGQLILSVEYVHYLISFWKLQFYDLYTSIYRAFDVLVSRF